MPELPEVETVRRGLAAVLEGATIIAVDQRRAGLRFPFPPDFPARLIGHRIEWLERRAKYLRAYLDSGEVLLMHLGMSGSFRIDAASPETPGAFHYPRHGGAIHDHVVFALSNGASVTYHDPRRFGFMLLAARNALSEHPLFVRLGVEPLDSGFSGVTVARLFSGRATTLKAALLDQTLVAGLGNIYVCEALHRAKLSPRRAAGTLARHDGSPTKGAHLLASVIKDVLSEAVAAGGSSLRDHRQADGQLGYFQHRFRVYDREGDPCPDPRCAGVVERIVQNGRSTFFCPACQR